MNIKHSIITLPRNGQDAIVLSEVSLKDLRDSLAEENVHLNAYSRQAASNRGKIELVDELLKLIREG